MLDYTSVLCSPMMQSMCPSPSPPDQNHKQTSNYPAYCAHISSALFPRTAVCPSDLSPLRHMSTREQQRVLNCWFAVRSTILLHSRKPRFHLSHGFTLIRGSCDRTERLGHCLTFASQYNPTARIFRRQRRGTLSNPNSRLHGLPTISHARTVNKASH